MPQVSDLGWSLLFIFYLTLFVLFNLPFYFMFCLNSSSFTYSFGTRLISEHLL